MTIFRRGRWGRSVDARGEGTRAAGLLIVRASTIALVMAAGLGTARAQDQIRRFTDPILVLNTGGHHAPVRALLFDADESKLLSAGMDKVVNVWDLTAARPRLSKTIRPHLWRGLGGAINAMALSPRGTLALAGFGVENQRGNIALYHFPGAADRPTGDLVGYLYSKDDHHRPEPREGHIEAIACLAFAPGDPNLLATGSGDGTVIVWDLDRKAPLAVLAAWPDREVRPERVVKALAYTPDGQRLAAGYFDGVIRIWDVRRPALAAPNPKPIASVKPRLATSPDAAGHAINALAISPDGHWIVVGLEGGELLRFDANAAPEALAASESQLPTVPRVQGAVEALAFSPGGKLATAIISQRPRARGDLPRVDCDVEIRSMPDGRVEVPVFAAYNRPANPVSNLVYALAFSPKGRYLAIAGGDQQGIFLHDLRAPGRAPVELKGRGRSVWDVGFARDGLAVAFSRTKPGAAGPARFEGFDLRKRTIEGFSRDQVTRTVETYDGWTVARRGVYDLELNRQGRRPISISLHPTRDGRWWAYSFIPPGPGHERPTLAVACNQGIVFFRLDDGRRTRMFAGHSGFVYCLAPSADGRWLVTGSSDQTVRLWRLAGCDADAPLGADLRRQPDGTRLVVSLAPRGFAEAMGLDPGDVIEGIGIGREKAIVADDKARADALFARVESEPSGAKIDFLVRREVPIFAAYVATERIPFETTRRDNAALSLFVGEDREWVLWMPRGYYDTSIQGDSEYLGWHLNRSSIYDPLPTDYLEIAKFEKDLRQPKRQPDNIIDRLLATADEVAALAVRAPATPEPPKVVREGRPPALTPVAVAPADLPAGAPPPAPILDEKGAALKPGEPLPAALAVVAGQPLILGFRIEPDGDEPLASFEIRLNGKPVEPLRKPDLGAGRPAGVVQVPVRIDPDPGVQRVAATVENARGIRRTALVDVEARGGPPPRRPKLRVLTIAPKFADRAIPPIQYGPEDAKELAKFLPKYLVGGEDGRPFGKAEQDVERLVGAEATSERIAEALRALDREPFEAGDLLVVLIESHVLNLDRAPRVVAADARRIPPDASVPADAIGQALGKVAAYGCKVILLLDGVHTASAAHWDSDVTEWVRHLRSDLGVITFVASDQGPSWPVESEGRRAFALALLQSIEATRPSARKDALFTLNDVREIVHDRVLDLTRRQQYAECYIPDTINGRFPLLNPKANVERVGNLDR